MGKWITQGQEQRYPRFLFRVLASFIDGAVLDLSTCAIVLLGLGLVFWIQVFLNSSFGHFSDSRALLAGGHDPFILQVILVFSRLTLSLIYYGWGTFRYGTTLGKRCFRIYVVSRVDPQAEDMDLTDPFYSPITLRQSLYRWLGYFASYAVPIGGGFFGALFHSQRRALHDLIANTVCITRDVS